jgi:hypothetical protein
MFFFYDHLLAALGPFALAAGMHAAACGSMPGSGFVGAFFPSQLARTRATKHKAAHAEAVL